MPIDEPICISRVEETFEIDRQRIVTGRVRVKTSSETVSEIAQATLAGETVDISREPIGKEVDRIPQLRVEGDVTIIPVVEEIVVVEKRLVLVEEIRIRRLATSEDVQIPVTLRKQRAVVERIDEPASQE
ncbi:DUF2382 domain-containing protein [Rhizobium sp. Leaf384]|uniref:DUF2382 domain-containing protein n=1 Tax=Rhizobium sp. Leaf384 TaxID=1736358 RepID=UPI0009E7D530|nr:DUF2382 domain-containing protein [Rhizobium sp. Leaf384]